MCLLWGSGSEEMGSILVCVHVVLCMCMGSSNQGKSSWIVSRGGVVVPNLLCPSLWLKKVLFLFVLCSGVSQSHTMAVTMYTPLECPCLAPAHYGAEKMVVYHIVGFFGVGKFSCFRGNPTLSVLFSFWCIRPNHAYCNTRLCAFHFCSWSLENGKMKVWSDETNLLCGTVPAWSSLVKWVRIS